jgi:phenylalanyl-tRNA synthetase beta chain
MYLSLNWLKAILNVNKVKLNFIKEKLILSGFEVEETTILKILNKNNIILNLTITTNRSDTLSLVGLTEEIKSLLGFQVRQLNNKIKNINYFNNFEKIKKISDKNFPSTNVLIFSEFKDINIKNIQPWIKKRLLCNKIIPQNNINDLAQYVMLEWGQPIFLYDFDKIKSLTKNNKPEFSIRFGNLGEKFIDSNFKEYSLNKETLIVTADDIPISIAGSIVSKECFVDISTKNIIIEGSIFNSKAFRKSERSIGIRTECSIFSERGINEFLMKAAYNRFLNLINLFNNNSLSNFEFYLSYSKFFCSLNKKIDISFENIKKVLGFNIINYDIELKRKINQYLSELNFRFSSNNETTWSILIPFTRIMNLEEEIDLIEEISRFYGFNNFKSVLPNFQRLGKLSRYETIKRKLRNSLINLGFIEVYNYSLISGNSNTPNIINPLITEYSSLRNNFVLQLLKTIEKNISQSNKIYPIFEIAHIFEKNNCSNYFIESELVCGIFEKINYRFSWLNKEIKLNWFQAIYFLQIIFEKLELEVRFSKKCLVPDYYHPKNCLAIFYENQEIGLFGEINTKFSYNKGLPKNFFLFELFFTKILSLKINKKPLYFKPYSLYPCLSANLSLLVPLKTNFEEIILIIKNCGKELIEEIRLFDVYEKFDLVNNYYSLSLELIFKSNQKTLLKTEINIILIEIENKLKKELNIVLRV